MNSESFVTLLGFGQQGWGAILLSGVRVTLAAALGGLILGLVIGTVVAWAKLAGGKVLRLLAEGYTTVLRGVPDLLVIYLFYFGSSAVMTQLADYFGRQGFFALPGFLAGTLAIGVIAGALSAEVLRGAFLAVAKGELEAATAFGMNFFLRFRRIIAPLTLRHAIPGISNVWLGLLKESSLLSVTGVAELMRQAQVAAGSTRLPFNFYLAAAALYILLACLSSILVHLSERHYSRGVRRA
ncbi:Octopine ABC transporter (plasmid) [Sodalis praecaptivus]|uniref:Octopine ABC transporter n=1 Tax=Sodalis praecaptivus TaxID=1239307 RepID=W0I431_9GAMM|nr:ABC transporter permease subunit [Sodalis praecaptivus]AHF79178.1 Octopine ABC transporter [Sodalis praecaptivus]